MTKLIVDIRPSLVALPFHRAFTRPLLEIDGVEREAAWGTTEVAVEAGAHRLAVYFRYRGQRTARLGVGHEEFTVDGSMSELRVTARLGARNGSSFRVVIG
ncbi:MULTISPECIES: hypothetical protein [unclassified Streptomyces]|uniref:hypothetical protein n=1 Tax=unclassified Streptomyces TaxID=2593676 RepID=UPI002E0F1D58|nr:MULTISPECIES: hypothetical protein [unclassified Streptomyces]WSR25890.1 hypothetical protein OG573_06905 [Streptomyces sp. NBC_01205]